MKIIHLIYSMHQGGAERFVADLANEQAKMGHDVIVACLLELSSNKDLSFNAQFLDERVTFLTLELLPGFSLRKVYKVSQWVNAQKADIVNCHLNVIPYIFPLAIKRGQTKFYHTIHSVANHASGSNKQRGLNRWFYRTNRIIPICISKECRISFEKYYGITQIKQIDNGRSPIVPSSSFHTVRNEVRIYKKIDNTPVFVHVARYHKAKNQKLLINAFNQLAQEGLDFILLIIGNGFDGEGKTLKDMACENIKFLGLKSNVGDYLLCSNAFCLSSEYEGLPISLLEAMSVGVVPICTEVGGIKDVIQDGQTGFLSPDLTIGSYIETIKRFLTIPIKKELIKTKFLENYSMTRCATEYCNLYQSE